MLAQPHHPGEGVNRTGQKKNNAMITVSIVDDEKELCRSIATFVNGAPGFRCVSMYHSGEAALERLPKDQPDVVLMDIHMTGINGIECAGRLKTYLWQDADLLNALCKSVGRELTMTEWESAELEPRDFPKAKLCPAVSAYGTERQAK